MHLTLKFLGNVDARELGGIDEALQRVAGAAKPARGRLCDIGSFPHMSRPRVLWVGVREGAQQLIDLAAATDAAMNEVGFARERRPFHPHVTLGRVRGARGLNQLRDAVEQREGFDAGEFPLDEIKLYESELGRGGARYTVLGTHRLAG